MENDQLRYLSINPQDEEWGLVVTTIGYQFIPPNGPYPLSRHPDQYNFTPSEQRTLNEYQLVYITKGSGSFTSLSVKKQNVTEGTMMMLFPGEWHNYYPASETGWDEYWVGFRGELADRLIEKQFLGKEEPLFHIGISPTIIDLYDKILGFAKQEKTGYQQMIASMAMHILGAVYYKQKNVPFKGSYLEEKIIEARQLIKANIGGSFSQEDIAKQLGLGYSWFRRMFKEYTGISPAQYQLQQTILKAKELMTDTSLNISEVAYRLHFENSSQFSTFFKKKEGITPSQFRERMKR